MWSQLLTTVLLSAFFWYYMKMRIWLDWDKPFLYRHAPGPCTQVLKDGGSEDLTHIGNGIILISSGYGTSRGKIMMMNVNGEPVVPYELNITNAPSIPHFMESPVGISTWKDEETGELTLFVITHPPDEDRVEVFELQTPASLKHVRSITDGLFRNMNDLVAVDKDKFYITRWLYARDLAYSYIEMFLFQYLGKIIFFDGNKGREVVSGLFMPNGINISPDKTTVYVANYGEDSLVGYRRQKNNDLVQIWSHDVGTGVDNIEVDSLTGDLWLGCHPLNYAISDYFGLFGFSCPAQVLKLKMSGNNVSEMIEVYADPDGSEAFASTSATYVDGKLVIGTETQQTVVCDSKFIK